MVTGIMKQNVSKMFSNQNELADIEGKSDNIRDTASKFRMNSSRLEKQAK